MVIKHQTDFVAGCFFIVVGLGAATVALTYDLGNIRNMGPGFFPLCLGVLLMFLGLGTVATAVAPGADKDELEQWDLKILTIITSSIVIFALLFNYLGMVLTIPLVVLVASQASHEFDVRRAIVMAAIFVIGCVLLFVYGLNLLLPVWPSFLY